MYSPRIYAAGIAGRKEEGKDRLAANSGNNVKSGPKYHNYHSPREESTVRRRRFSTHVIRGNGERAKRGFKLFLPCNYSPRNSPPLSRDESINIARPRLDERKKVSRASTCERASLLASHFVVFGELCSCS